MGEGETVCFGSIAFGGLKWRARHGLRLGKEGLAMNCGESGDGTVRVRMIMLLWIYFWGFCCLIKRF